MNYINCTCKQKKGYVYAERYDAKYCPQCDVWVEPDCDCGAEDYCPFGGRPEKPSMMFKKNHEWDNDIEY